MLPELTEQVRVSGEIKKIRINLTIVCNAASFS